ncbi:MAG: FkbM family methyltransferase [Candidatus Obscuribacterales bacterium]|nr:FkbM family methyltransferase [Candidatus Obscuribacterales bacterium]
MIFDVGANEGQTIKSLKRAFPKSTIHSFEPSPELFLKLKQNYERDGVHVWNLGLGAESKQSKLYENSSCSGMNSFLELGEFGWGEIAKESLINIDTVDNFCRQQKIDQIDLLKSDTQGFDLEVVKGAAEMIGKNKIGLVFIEICFLPLYKNAPTLGQIYDYLIERNFYCFNIYHIYRHQKLAGWTDCLFVHKSYLE